MKIVALNNLTGEKVILDVDESVGGIQHEQPEPTVEELLQAEIVTLKSRLAKIESTATVKAELTAVPIVKER